MPATVICFTLYALGYRDIVTMMGLCAAVMIITRGSSKTRLICWLVFAPRGGRGREDGANLSVGLPFTPSPEPH